MTYIDGDAYIGENKDDPNWVWDLEKLTDKTATAITSTDDGRIQKLAGPILGIENNDVRDDDTDNPAGLGECYSYPNGYAQICLDSLTVNDDEYLTTTIEYRTAVDLAKSGHPEVSSSEKTIYIKAPLSEVFELTNGKYTSEIWLAKVESGLAVFYKDESVNPNIVYLKTVTSPGDSICNDINYGSGSYDIYISMPASVPRINVLLQNGYEWINAQFTYDANDIISLGQIASAEESHELSWRRMYPTSEPYVNIGTKDEDHRTIYGTIIRDPRSNGRSDKVVLQIPREQVQANVVVKGLSIDYGGPRVTPGVTEDILLGNPIAGSTTWGFDWKFDDSDISTLQDTIINFNNDVIDVHDAIILSKKSPIVATSLTSQDDDYESNIFLEKMKDSTTYYYYFDESLDLTKANSENPLVIKFLGKTLKIIGVTDSSITVQQ